MKLLKTRNFTKNGFTGQILTYELDRNDYIFYGDKDTGLIYLAIHKKLCDKNHYNYWYYHASYTQHFKHEGKELFMSVHLRNDYKEWGLTSDDGKGIIVKWKEGTSSDKVYLFP